MLRRKPLLAQLRSRLRAVLERDRQVQRVDDELALHIELETEDLIRRGLSPREARRQALACFGSVPRAREECREQWGLAWIEDIARDLRQGIRSLRRSPTFTVAALANLGLGIAATLVVFSVVEAVLLEDPPFSEPDRVVRFFELTPEGMRFSVSDQNLLDFRERSTMLSGIAAIPFPDPTLLLELGQVRQRVVTRGVTANFFETLGVDLVQGRSWDDSEVVLGSANRTALISEELWQTLFPEQTLGGQTVQLGGETWELLGIVPRGFRFEGSFDLYFPYAVDHTVARGDHRLSAVARLAPGATLEGANDELVRIANDLAEEFPRSNRNYGAELVPVQEWLIGDEARRSTVALSAAVGLLLLLTCANVAGLLSARSSRRNEEFALRRALGAGRGRLLRQLSLEAFALGLCGATLGTALAAMSIPLIRAGAADALPGIDLMRLSPLTVAVAAGAGGLTSIIFGMLPAWRASAAANRSRGANDLPLRSGLVVAQLAIALVLTVGASTLLTSFGRLAATDAGFTIEGLITAQVVLPTERYPENSREPANYYTQALEQLAAIPGVTSVGASTLRPFVGYDLRNTVGLPTMESKTTFEPVLWRAVMPGTFQTMGLAMLRCRDFQDTETTLVTIISESLAARLFEGRDPIGEQVRWIAPQGPLATVVGVVADVRDLAISQTGQPTYYWPQTLMGWQHMSLYLRSSMPLDELREQVVASLSTIDATLPPPELHLTSNDLEAAIASPRLNSMTFLAFAGLAALTALVGLYGLVSYSVASRRSEIAVRLSLGAMPRGIGLQYAGRALGLLAIAGVLAVVVLFASEQVLQSLLHETRTFEPRVLAVTSGLFLLTVTFASAVPALRTARRPITDALREE